MSEGDPAARALEQKRQWAKANPERVREANRRYRERHPDRIAAQREERRDVERERLRRWYAEHRDEVKTRGAARRRRRAALEAAAARVTALWADVPLWSPDVANAFEQAIADLAALLPEHAK